MTKQNKDFLFKLLETPSPTGFEMPGQRCWAKEIKKHADKVECDAYGSTWATLAGSSKKSVMLEAHADEIGYMVKHITSEGFLRLERVGGSDVAVARGRRLRVFGDKGEVIGVIGNTAIHLRPRGQEKTPNLQDLWVDVGANDDKEVAKFGIRVGHPAVYLDGPMEMANGRIVSRAIDNRIGGYIISEVMKKVGQKGQKGQKGKARKKASHSLLCLNAVQEEVGGNGAQMATHRLFPDVAICFDVTHATDTPGLDHAEFGKVTLGGGPALAHGTANHPLVVERLIKVAKENKITIQHEAVGRFTGTDTDTIFTIREGIPSALISLPLRSMHSVVETADIKDIDACIDLMAAFVLSLKATDTFHHKL